MKAILRSGFLVLAIMAHAVPANAGPYEDGDAAYGRGDYEAALRLWRPLAEQGVAEAQYWIGSMYDNGRGVSTDRAEAAMWYRRAADQGNVNGQFYLGFLYITGNGVPLDIVFAYMWFNLAAAQNDLLAPAARDMAAERMTPNQIAEAQRMARKWMAMHRQ